MSRVVIGLVAIVASGCSEDSGCVPGASVACACPGGEAGVQVCLASRTFAPCACGPSRLDGGDPSDIPGADAPRTDITTDAPRTDIPTDSPPVEQTIGPAGGTVTLGALRLQFPAGAVATPTRVRVTATSEAAPAGYRAFSPMYRFEPEGTTFAQPVSLTLPFDGDMRLATVFWSRAVGGGYERLGGVPSAGGITVSVSHFSTGFVADGVDYSETPDRTCARTRVLDTRFGDSTGIPSAVALFFGVEDCLGRPMPGLASADFETVEDGTPVSSEGRPVVLPAPGLQNFVTLSLDLSSSTQAVLPQVIGAARALVDQFAAASVPVQVAVEVFAGDPEPVVWQRPTLDLAQVRTRLDALGSFTPTDRSSTNLYGAVVSGVTRLESSELAFEQRNGGGAFARGYLVLFTDGADTAGRVTLTEAVSSAARARNQVVTVGLRGADFGEPARAALQRLGGGAYVEVSDPAVLEREFRFMAARIAGQTRATYVLGYCTPRRSGSHPVGVRVTGATRTAATDNTEGTFDATGFGAGCAVEAFDRATRCGDAQCGGLGCGACDDRSDTCDWEIGPAGAALPTRQCVNNCVTARQCGGAMLTNALGYTQRCDDQLGAAMCSGTCADTRSDVANCGACNAPCVAACSAGVCLGVTQLVSSDNDVCARLSDGNVRCWGYAIGSRPRAVQSLTRVAELAAGLSDICALMNDGTARCWSPALHDAPTEVPGLTSAVQIAVGSAHACARLRDGSVRCWGNNLLGQLGDGTTTNHLSPTVVPGLAGVEQIASSGTHTCARLSDGSVRCWGENIYGQLGNGTTTNLLLPTAVTGLTGASQIALGYWHTCASLSDGSVRCWGMNDRGQLGDGTTIIRLSPTVVLRLTGVTGLAASYWGSYAWRSDGSAFAWGNGSPFGPNPITGLTDVTQIAPGGQHNCARSSNGSVRCWGENSYGQLGDGTTISHSTPAAVRF